MHRPDSDVTVLFSNCFSCFSPFLRELATIGTVCPLPGNAIYWGIHEWNRLADRIHRQIREQTGNDLLAESIAATVGSVLDGLLSGYVGEQVAGWEAGELTKKKPNQQ